VRISDRCRRREWESSRLLSCLRRSQHVAPPVEDSARIDGPCMASELLRSPPLARSPRVHSENHTYRKTAGDHTRLPSICPSTFTPSPRITVWFEMMLPFIVAVNAGRAGTVNCPRASRLVDESCPSSLAPLFCALGHFHAMSKPPVHRLLSN